MWSTAGRGLIVRGPAVVVWLIVGAEDLVQVQHHLAAAALFGGNVDIGGEPDLGPGDFGLQHPHLVQRPQHCLLVGVDPFPGRGPGGLQHRHHRLPVQADQQRLGVLPAFGLRVVTHIPQPRPAGH